MAIYKVTFAFVNGVTGWSENYYTDSGTPAAAVGVARQLAMKRIALCGDGVAIPHIRVSDITIRGDALIDQLPGFHAGVGGPVNLVQIKNATPGEFADVSWTAALVSYSANNVIWARTFMRGIADFLFVGDRIFIPTQDWKKFFGFFDKEFSNPANGWGWTRKAKQTPTNTKKIKSATAVANTDTVVRVEAGFTGIVGQTAVITGLKSDRGTLNGQFLIVDVTGADVTIAKQFATNSIPIFKANTGKIRVLVEQFVTPLSASWSPQATSRRAGRPFGSPVGRRKRVLLLP